MPQSPLDTRLGAIGLIFGAIAVGYVYYKERSATVAALPPGSASDSGGGGLVNQPANYTGTPLQRLTAFAKDMGLTITSGLRSGSTTPHAPGFSLHNIGHAIDVGGGPLSTPEGVQTVTNAAQAQGFNVLPELYQGYGPYGYSTGPHLHISISPPGTTLK